MTNDLFIKIVSAILSIIIALITAYVIPAIKSKISSQDLETILWIIETAVKCADQIFTKEQWQQKKTYVMQYVIDMADKYIHIKLTPEELDALIEGVVNELHENGVREVIE